MGMDVYTKDGDGYFRRNVWGWHPLADCVTALHPDLTENCSEWHSNSGDGLNAEDSAELAAALRADLADGTVRRWLDERIDRLGRLPRVPCFLCHGTGLRTDAVGVEYGYDRRRFDEATFTWSGGCNACHGVGTEDDFALSYGTDEASVLAFAEFLELAAQQGGFEID